MSAIGRRRIMTRTRTESIGLRSNVTTTTTTSTTCLYPTRQPVTASSEVEMNGSMDSAIMASADALATGDEMVVVADVSSSIEHHHQSSLMNGITVTLANGGTVTVGGGGEEEDGDSNNKYDVADKDEHDLGAIDFAGAVNHNNMETHPMPSGDGDGGDKTQCYGANPDEDNETVATMMIVDSVGATETASSSSSSNSNSSSSSSSSNSNSSSTSSSSGTSVTSRNDLTHREPEEPANAPAEHEEEEEEDVEEEEEEDEDEPVPMQDEEQHNVDVKITVDKLQLQMMQTDDDPLLQETINALMNGSGGIEVVNTSEHDPIEPTATDVTDDPSIVNVMSSNGRPANDEIETDRNYQCTYCGKLFTRSNTLAYHLKVHTGERPFKCKHCAKAFREQYRLMKHLKTHSKYRNRRLEQQHAQGERPMMAPIQRNSSTVTALVAGTNGLVAAGEEDYTTGDSERFFKSYDLPDGSVAMKLEPDISLTEDADVSEEVGGPEAMLATEEVETAEEQLQQQIVEEQEEDPNAMQECVAPGAGSEIRYQIMEERIKSLQREVHMVNKNLSRVESKVDGLTRIISLFIGKFEDETELANQAAQQQQQHQEQQDQKSEQEQEQEQEYTTVSPEGETIVPIAMMTPEQQQHSSSSTSPSIQPKTIFLTSTSAALQSASAAQVQVQPVTVFQSASSPTITPRQHRSGTVAKETHTNTHYYQFTDPTTVVHLKPEGSPSPRVSSPSPTPPPGTVHTSVQHLTLASNGGNQLLDTFPDIPELPIRTVSDFLDLNDHCTDNEQFLLQMMIRLHQEIHNSQPFQRNIKRMMEALVTYEVLCQFSWSGKSAINGQYTKYVFGNSLGIIDLLTKTLNLGKSAQEAEANHKPIFAAIQSFIKHSRQNMIRDSRKRRDPMRSVLSLTGAGGEMVAGMVPDTTTAIAYHINGGERLQTKQQRSERHHHQQTELVNPF